jgi:hypothetical protein
LAGVSGLTTSGDDILGEIGTAVSKHLQRQNAPVVVKDFDLGMRQLPELRARITVVLSTIQLSRPSE